jgi:serine/threonine protein kinase
MTLSRDSKLGSYEILSPLGAGGMGEVYRARDTRLGREVALKVLPTPFASDPERMARFQREAQVLASLNHPRIGAIYGFEDSDGIRALVMELIEGPLWPIASLAGLFRLMKRCPLREKSRKRSKRLTIAASFTEI